MTAAPAATPLPGMPTPPVPPAVQRAADYETWLAAVRPAFVAAADSGEPFTISQIAADAALPDPPNPQAQWGQLPKLLAKEGLIRAYFQTGNSVRRTVHSSLVHMWIGVPVDQRAEAAA
jgi:hypothetical protein